MGDTQPAIRAIFCEALDRNSPTELTDFLDEACHGNSELRRRVEALLHAHAEASGFLQERSAHLVDTIARPVPGKGAGTIIGPYKLMEQIGEGGMGLVFVA